MDVKSAVRFLRARASEYGLDPAKFVAAGSSAGGHLVSMLGTTANNETFMNTNAPYSNISDEVQAVVNFYGPTYLRAMDADASEAGCPSTSLCHSCEDSPETMLLDCPTSECTDRADLASPVFHANETAPPFLTIHGVEDCTVPTPQGARLHAALLDANVESTLIEVPEAGHNLQACLAGDTALRIQSFVEHHMRGCHLDTAPPHGHPHQRLPLDALP